MKDGRELDALVAEKVMGWSNCHREGEWGYLGRPYGGPRDFPISEYSTDIAAAWEVLERLRERFRWSVFSTESGFFCCHIFSLTVPDELLYFADARTTPLAICFAALKAVDVTPGARLTP